MDGSRSGRRKTAGGTYSFCDGPSPCQLTASFTQYLILEAPVNPKVTIFLLPTVNTKSKQIIKAEEPGITERGGQENERCRAK